MRARCKSRTGASRERHRACYLLRAMNERMLIIGGGVAGLSAGCYGRMNGWETQILEQSSDLGGLCTDWLRGDYRIDGCIQWLMGAGEGGWFRSLYEELGITREVPLRPLDLLVRYEDPRRGAEVHFGRDLERLRRELRELSSRDEAAMEELFGGIRRLHELRAPLGDTPELASWWDRIHRLWDMRHLAGTILHFRGSISTWCDRHVESDRLREALTAVLSPEMPALFLPVLLSQLADGQLSRPIGGSGRVRDALVRRYRELGGEVRTEAMVDEVLVEDDRAVGVRLGDGSEIRSDVVISTSSYPETALQLLGGRYLDRDTRERVDRWRTFDPILLLSVGVSQPLEREPTALLVRQERALSIGGPPNPLLYLRVFNEDPSFAPEGHAVVQTMVSTSYDWWATRGERYQAEKDAATVAILERMEERLPALHDHVKMTDLATPLSFWRWARSWRGAYEGWLPTPQTFHASVPKTFRGLRGLYVSGQWVEPGGGIPVALLSSRQLVQILCERLGRRFRAQRPEPGDRLQFQKGA